VCGSKDLTKKMMEALRIELGETTADKRFTLVELECLGACGTAPVALVNDVLHEELTPQKLQKIVEALPEDPHNYKDPTIDWESKDGNGHEAGH
jgi:NADH:ubiquinone oxidoreductase subunit E